MPAGVWSRMAKWKTFADVVAIVLGINVWVTLVLVPGFFVDAWSTNGMLMAGLLPLPVLCLGLWRRSEMVLLLAFPASLLVPIALQAEIVSVHTYGPIRFTIVAIGLIAYLFGASFFTSFYEPPPPVGIRPLSSSRQPVPDRWKRRFRVYRYLTLLSVAFPAVLVYVVNFHYVDGIRDNYTGRFAAMSTFLNLLVIGTWLGLYVYIFLGILKPHRTGDRDLITKLAQIKEDAKRGRPRPVFYVAVVAALALMILLMLTRRF